MISELKEKPKDIVEHQSEGEQFSVNTLAKISLDLVLSSDVRLWELLSSISKPTDVTFFNGVLDEIEEHFLMRNRCGLDLEECQSWWEHSTGVSLKGMSASSGTIIIGKEHRMDDFTILQSGSLLFYTSDGPLFVSAPQTMTSVPGTRKLGLAMGNLIVYNVVPNPNAEKDEELLEDSFTKTDDIHRKHLSLGNPTPSDEFNLYLAISGETTDSIDLKMSLMEHEKFLHDLLLIKDSEIEGKGIFAKRDIEPGYRFEMLKDGERTQLARYTNHSFNPNAISERQNNDLFCTLINGAKKGEEILTNYLHNMQISNEIGGKKCLAQ